jgi:hypothetical protein
MNKKLEDLLKDVEPDTLDKLAEAKVYTFDELKVIVEDVFQLGYEEGYDNGYQRAWDDSAYGDER